MFKFVLANFFVASTYAASILSGEPDYEYFKSTIYPGYGVRFVSPNHCDPNVTQHAGYLDMGANHYHFWLFESKENPSESPMTSWLSGGPGCTGQLGVWLDNGPCISRDGSSIEYRNTTWTQFSNMFYIDQPTGTGYSYGDKIQGTSLEGAAAYYEALQLFYEAFPKYSKLPFYIVGESFGGRMAPVFAKYIIEQNLKLKEGKDVSGSRQIIPLKSIMLANGWINPRVQHESMVKLACEDHKLGISASPLLCKITETSSQKCYSLLDKCDETPDDNMICLSAGFYCNIVMGLPITLNLGRNQFDIREKYGTRHPEEYIKLLNNPNFQKSIGAKYTKIESLCDNKVGSTQFLRGELAMNTAPTLAAVLDYDISVLVLAGDQDFTGNWYGQMEVLSKLKFNGSESYNQLELRPWGTQHEKYGEVKGTDKLTFVRLFNASHEATYTKPKETLIIFDNWINGKEFVYN